jgi:Holliday junction resolvase RusA-like endonuclease
VRLIKFEIPGPPVSWKSHGGYGKKSYNPRHKEKQEVQWLIREQRGVGNYTESLLGTGPVTLVFDFMLPIPKYLSKNKDVLSGKISHLKKPDCTNMQKFYEDCLKGLIFKDDSQVISVHSQKYYSQNPRTLIEIEIY